MKNNKKLKSTIRFLIGITLGIIVSAVGVYAATIIGKGSNLTYDNTSSNLSSTNIQDALDELKSSLNCPEGKICVKTPLKLGDYISMTPTKSSYKIDTSKTGFHSTDDYVNSTQTINPQELNLWRVISIKPDGTVDMISEHVSSTSIYFNGQEGYLNLVGYLNVLASQYENSTYTKGSRYFGYNGQTEYITDTSKFTTTAPWTCSTGGSCNPIESQGGGDELYTKDYNLVKNVLGTAIATRPNSDEAAYYWVASRYYRFEDISFYAWHCWYVNTTGSISVGGQLYYSNGSDFASDYGIDSALRPILTLKSELKYSGSGTEEDPYTLSK